MKAFISWSSGKDCMYAMHRFLADGGNEVFCLLNMSDANSDRSRSHGIRNELIRRQSEKVRIPLIQQPTTRAEYEKDLKAVMAHLKKEHAVDTGVFGDIFVREHKTWIERVCHDMDITPVFPLWGMDTEVVMNGFLKEGYKSIVISVRKNKLPPSFLGRIVDEAFINDLRAIPGMDVCGENGEYHTFVFDGPSLADAVPFEKGEITENETHHFLQLR
ncbi:MAG TPA: diphthine--ammonia ligase [Porphyromonadaceae bacterium]|nr:diphthine--ammonia ligase [Porphyromonadaceae bacterium]